MAFAVASTENMGGLKSPFSQVAFFAPRKLQVWGPTSEWRATPAIESFRKSRMGGQNPAPIESVSKSALEGPPRKHGPVEQTCAPERNPVSRYGPQFDR